MPNRKTSKLPKPVPRFANETEEREFWETHDTSEYLDLSQAHWVVFPNLKPSTETISLRLPAGLLAELKMLANRRDVPYQSLLKVFLAERVAYERAADAGGAAMRNKRLQPRRPRTASRSKQATRSRPRG